MSDLSKLMPQHKTIDVCPDAKIHGDVVLAWDESRKRFVPVAPAAVVADQRRFTHWHPDRRHADIGHATERRANKRENGNVK